MKPDVSILVSTYNHENYISECLQSILAQSFFKENKNFEILIYDDGSTDQTQSIAEQFVLKNPQIKYFTEHQRGMSFGLNLMIEKAQSDFIFSISADDKFLPNRVFQQRKILTEKPQTLTFSRPQLISETGQGLNPSEFPVFFQELPLTPEGMFRKFFFDANFLCAPSFAARKRDVLEIGKFNELSLQVQDFEYWIRALKKGFNIYVNKQPWVEYRIFSSGKNLSATKNDSRMLFEHKAVYGSFFENAPVALLKAAFANELEPASLQDERSIVAQLEMLMAKHPVPAVRHAALDLIYKKHQVPEWKKAYEDLKFTEAWFFSVANQLTKPQSLYKKILQRIPLLEKFI